jgi:hypothetical protein
VGKDNHSTVEQVARIVRESLEQGNNVEIDRLGLFRYVSKGEFEFVPKRAPSVFLSYVEEDIEAAGRLHKDLAAAGLDPWMDRKNLLPGQNWPRAIERSIELCDFFIACLSRKSLLKKSIFQSEMRYALDCARRQPLDSIYFIPVRLEECEVPWTISQHLQYVDLFPDFQKGVRRIASMIRKEAALQKWL